MSPRLAEHRRNWTILNSQPSALSPADVDEPESLAAQVRGMDDTAFAGWGITDRVLIAELRAAASEPWH